MDDDERFGEGGTTEARIAQHIEEQRIPLKRLEPLRPAPTEARSEPPSVRARSILIRPVLNGFIVEVGCQKVVCTSVIDLANEVARYYGSPSETEEYYLTHPVNR